MVTVSVGATVAGLDALTVRLDEATRQIAADAAHLIQAKAMSEAPVGKPGNSTNAPGDLRRSIDVEGPFGGAGMYGARVGPTVIYGRQRELGGDIYPKVARSLVFTKFGTTIYSMHVHQDPNRYLLRGEVAALPDIEAVAHARIAVAIAGG